MHCLHNGQVTRSSHLCSGSVQLHLGQIGGGAHFAKLNMVNLSGTSAFTIELSESFSMGHVTVKDGAYFASLSITEYPRSSTFVEQEIHFFEALLSGFLINVNIAILIGST